MRAAIFALARHRTLDDSDETFPRSGDIDRKRKRFSNHSGAAQNSETTSHREQHMLGSFNFARPASRFLILAALVAVSVPAAMTIGADGAAYAQRGGGGGSSGGDGGRKRTTIIDCTGGDCTGSIIIPPRRKPEITYIKKNDACEIRTCEIKAGHRSCSSEMADLKVCSTKRG
jgi:hypothetical protein